MQPEGLRESSRWSENHQSRVVSTRTLKGVPDIPTRVLHPCRVLLLFQCFPVVFATRDHRLLSRSPSGWGAAKMRLGTAKTRLGTAKTRLVSAKMRPGLAKRVSAPRKPISASRKCVSAPRKCVSARRKHCSAYRRRLSALPKRGYELRFRRFLFCEDGCRINPQRCTCRCCR
jgi:hypothetical protein